MKVQFETFFKEKGFLGDSNKLFEKILNGNDELARLLKQLLSQGLGTSKSQTGFDYGAALGKFRPPVAT